MCVFMSLLRHRSRLLSKLLREFFVITLCNSERTAYSLEMVKFKFPLLMDSAIQGNNFIVFFVFILELRRYYASVFYVHYIVLPSMILT